MTVLLVLFTFVTFLLIDYFRTRKTVVHPALKLSAAKGEVAVPRLQPALVAGFEVPGNLRYHPGHTWALSESPNLVRVGMDDFASKLTGTLESIALPQRGQWIRQGQKLCTIHRDGCEVDMVSPIEGTVSDINEGVAKNPKLALGGPLARWWTEESASRLQRRMPMALAGALAQDGGVAMDNVAAQIPDEQWLPLAKEFFLS
jgi:glycine cleavage system H protein